MSTQEKSTEQMSSAAPQDNSTFIPALKIIFCSLLGLFAYFITFKVRADGPNTILIDHIANEIRNALGKNLVSWICIMAMVYGATLPFRDGSWNTSLSNRIFAFFKVAGIPVGLLYILKTFHNIQIGPDGFYTPGMLPFLFEKLAWTLTFVIPIGSAFIIFLTDYGLMEFTGVFARPFMRPVYKTPGRSAIDAVASFVGSFSIALIITGKQYRSGYYTKKEAAIIATGFSTVSATFCVIVAKTLGLMDHWDLFFWGTLLITFIVTALTVRLWPLASIPDDYYAEKQPDEPIFTKGLFKEATKEGLNTAAKSVPILKNMFSNLIVGIKISSGLVSSIMSVGFLGLLLAEYTPVFTLLGYTLYPFTLLLGLEEPLLVSKALAMGIAEMFLPAALGQNMGIHARFIIGVTSISEILFFSASIPCMVAMGIPISIRDMVIVWYERVVLTLLITTPIAYMLF